MADPMESQQLFEFAQQAPSPAEAPVEPQPAPEVEPTPAPASEVPPAPTAEPPQEAVPPWRLREEAEARRLAEDRARQLEQRLNEVAARIQQSAQPTSFFDNPDAATAALVQKAMTPYIEENRRALMQLGKMVAGQAHGQDKVDSAEKAFLEAMNAQTLDPMDYEKVVQSPNRYDAVVRWHRAQGVLSAVGDDPNAWFEKQLETRLADPKFQAALIEKVRAGAAAKPGVVKIPPSLSRTTSAQGNGPEPIGDMSDQSLFAHAMKR